MLLKDTQNDHNMLVEELETPDEKQDIAIINPQPMEEDSTEKEQYSADNCELWFGHPFPQASSPNLPPSRVPMSIPTFLICDQC